MRGSVVYAFAGSLLLALLGSVVYGPSVHGAALLMLVCILFGCLRAAWSEPVYACVAGVALAGALGILRVSSGMPELPARFAERVGASVTLEGTVVRIPDERESSVRATIELTEEGERTRVLAVVPRYPPLEVGDRVRVRGKIERPEPFDGEGGRRFPYDRFLEKDGIFLIMHRAWAEPIGVSSRPYLLFLRPLARLRVWFSQSLDAAIPEPASALASGIIVGGKQGLGKELLKAFEVAGMLQLVVLSGYNVAVVADGVMRSLVFLPRRFAALTASIVVLCFVLAAGAESSALRAGLMTTVAILARASHRTYDAPRILVLTLCAMALVNPRLLAYDPGLQFSFLATLGLLLGTPIVERWIRWVPGSTAREILASTVAAQIGVLPLLLWQTGNLSIVSVAANALAAPVIPAAMATSALAAVIAGLFADSAPLIAPVAGVPAYLLLSYVINLATFSADLPYARVILPAFPFWMVTVAYAFLGALVWRCRDRVAASTAHTSIRSAAAIGH